MNEKRWHGELNKICSEMLVDLHDCGHVAAAVAVVRCRENSDETLVVKPVVAFHDKLMCTDNEVKAILAIEFFGNVVTESVASTTWGDAPPKAIIRVAPHEIANGALVGYLVCAI